MFATLFFKSFDTVYLRIFSRTLLHCKSYPGCIGIMKSRAKKIINA